MKKIYLYIAIVVILLATFVISLIKGPSTDSDTNTVKTEQISCNGIEIISPIAENTVTFPLAVSGIIHPAGNIGTPYPWGVFEAEAGTVVIKDEDGTVLSDTALISLTVDWMNTDPKPFSVVFPALTGTPDNDMVWIHFGDNNAKDGVPTHTCVIPVRV
jgi:hypothetical protein